MSLFFLSDDQGWGDLSMNGNANLKTPHIDSLASDGASFERFYVQPVCSPTRAEMLTGRYHQRGGVYSTSQGGERLDLDERTLAEVFQAAGYATGAFGKWHNGMQFPYHPNAHGFDEFYGYCSGHWGSYFSPMLERNGEIVRGEGFLTVDLTTKALDFIAQNKEKPFLCYLPFNTPHSPMQVPQKYWERFAEKDLVMTAPQEDVKFTKAALAMCENIDVNVGRVLEKLERLDLEEDTMVIYFSDNGPNSWRWNGGMKGKKGWVDEGGVRSPLLVRWQGKIAPKLEVSALSSAIDLLPTLVDLAGIPMGKTKPLDGRSLKMALLGKAEPELAERKIFASWGGRDSVRTDRYRLDDKGALFDMTNDLGQTSNVAANKPEVARELAADLAAWRVEMREELGKDERPFIIAHPASRFTQIPARDGVAHGKIKRSSQHPNDSFFTNWKTTDEVITWDAEVAATGQYEVEIFYTCAAENVGSLVELTFGETKLQGRISKAHDSPLIGAANDRVPRDESYVKDWQRATLGVISLENGTGTLSLRALEVPGEEVMDFRMLFLTRKDQ